MSEKYTLEENQLLADNVIEPIMKIVNENIILFNPDRMRATLESMCSHQRTTAAWPFPESINKAENMAAQNALFESIIELFEHRRSQAKKMQGHADHDKMLKTLGFIE